MEMASVDCLCCGKRTVIFIGNNIIAVIFVAILEAASLSVA